MLNAVTEIWKFRHLLWSLVRGDVARRYRRTPVGVMLSFLKPLGMTAVFCLVFSKLFELELRDYVPFLLCGMTVWHLLQESMQGGCFCFHHASPFLFQRSLPLGLFPLRTVLLTCHHVAVLFLLTLGLILVCKGELPLWGVGFVMLILPLIILLCWSLALIVGVLNTYNPETHPTLETGLQVLYVLTPVLYPPEIFRQNHLVSWIDLNPLTYVLEVVRRPLLDGVLPPLSHVAIFCGVVLAVFGIALVTWRRAEKRLVFWIRPAPESV